MQVVFVSSYVPRKCGIATYTRDLSEELTKQGVDVKNVVMENDVVANLDYPPSVIHRIRQHELADYAKVAADINHQPGIDFVHIQHEFGLYGGPDGEYILEFAKLLKKPVVTTLHTVLVEPGQNQKRIIRELARLSRAVIVMEEIAEDRLENIYAINPHDIHVIFHGVPSIHELDMKHAKKQIGYTNNFMMIASNLISRNKGFEYVLEGLPKVVTKIPNFMFLIIGETHPIVRHEEGESYREELQALVKKHRLENNVHFINQYITLEELRVFLTAADIYITPYLDPQQITSGTLAYAIGMGKACISTPYLYAQNILDKGRGILVPFKDSEEIANAIIKIHDDPKARVSMEHKAYKLGQKMRWPFVAEKHAAVYKVVSLRHTNTTMLAESFIKKPINLSYLKYLTDEVGMIQHAHYIIPESRYGYSTDDNARALIIVAELYKRYKTERLSEHMKAYLTFLRMAQTDNGAFHTFLNFQREWIDNSEIADPYGKAMWALGYTLYLDLDSPFTPSIHEMFKISMNHIDQIRDIRAAAYTILGLYYYVTRFDKKKDTAFVAEAAIHKLAEFLIMFYENYHAEKWLWFEDKITYDNFRLPQALLAAYIITNQERYKDIALKTLNFITECNYDRDKDYFDFIGQDGWYEKGSYKANYDQQPLEASAAVSAYIFAHEVTGEKSFSEKAFTAFEWFFGRNRNHAMLYDKKTGGVFDGLTPTGVNMNEGAESLVCFLVAQMAIQDFLRRG